MGNKVQENSGDESAIEILNRKEIEFKQDDFIKEI